MLLLGVVQAQAAGDEFLSSFDLLDERVLTTTTASVTFSSLGDYAADYQHLQVRFALRNNSGGRTTTSVRSVLNGDTGSNYNGHGLGGNSSSVFSFTTGTTTSAISGIISTTDTAANIFGAGVIDLLDPFSTTKNKTFRTLSGTTGGNRIDLHSGLYISTATVTSWLLKPEADSFVANGRISLYGIKAV